jgi:regulator of protease activity HflC (stomatin/prohibitin superfamily)
MMNTSDLSMASLDVHLVVLQGSPQGDRTQFDAWLEQVGAYLQGLDATTWFWVGAAFILPSLLPSKTFRFPTFFLMLSIGLLPSQVSFLIVLLYSAFLVQRIGLVKVPEGTTANILRLGKFARTLNPGLHFIVPGLESVHLPVGLHTVHDNGKRSPLFHGQGFISTREFILDPDPHEMICSDNSVVTVDSIAYLSIVKPKRAVFGVESLGESVLKLVETVLRQEVGKLDADSVISARDVISAKLQDALTIACEPWGTAVLRVEIQDISFKKELQDALSKAREAELEGRAQIVAAERTRDATVAQAEGQKRKAELEAEAALAKARADAEADYLKESRKREGEAAGLRAISDALKETPEAMVLLEAIKRQPDVARGLGASDGLLVVPNEAAGLIGSVATLFSSWEKVKGRVRTEPSE